MAFEYSQAGTALAEVEGTSAASRDEEEGSDIIAVSADPVYPTPSKSTPGDTNFVKTITPSPPGPPKKSTHRANKDQWNITFVEVISLLIIKTFAF